MGPYCVYAASFTSRDAGSITKLRICINPPCHPECRSLSSTTCEAFSSARPSFSRSEATETGNVTRIGPCLFAPTFLEAIEPTFSERTGLLSYFRRTIHGNSAPRSQNVSQPLSGSKQGISVCRAGILQESSPASRVATTKTSLRHVSAVKERVRLWRRFATCMRVSCGLAAGSISGSEPPWCG